MAVPAGITVAWPSSAASIPAGWTRAAQLDGLYVRGAPFGTDPTTAGGSASGHTHASGGHTHAFSLHTHSSGGQTGIQDAGTGSHVGGGSSISMTSQHIHSIANTWSSASGGATGSGSFTWATNTGNDPAYLAVIWITSDGTPIGFPAFCVAYWAQTSLPTGWSLHPAAKAAYLKGAATAADGGTSGGSNTHSHAGASHGHGAGSGHSHGTNTTGPPLAASVASGGGALADADTTHTHTASDAGGFVNTAPVATAGSGAGASGEPPYYMLGTIQNASGGLSWPLNVIAIWQSTLASIPAGWAQVTAMATNFARGASNLATDIGVTGGATTHTHGAGGSHAHIDNHTHTVSASTTFAGSVANVSGAGSVTVDPPTHGHLGTGGQMGPSSAPSTASGTDTAGAIGGDTRPAFVDVAFIQYTASNTISVTTPTVGGTVATPEVAAAWTLSGGRTQATYRVQIATDAGMTAIVFDTGIQTSATQSATVPAAPTGPPYAAQYGFVRGTVYYLQVTAIDVNGVTSISSVVNFTATWTAPAVPSGLAATPNAIGLPQVALSWTQVVPGGADAFQHYNVYRQPIGTTGWTRIAALTGIGTLTYADYNAEPGVAYTYALSATYTRSGSVFESALSTTAAATLTFKGIWLHDAAAPSAQYQWQGNAGGATHKQPQATVQAWGQQTPVVYVGEVEYTPFQLTGRNDVPYTSIANWKGVLPLVQRQRTLGSVMHYRNGLTNESAFVVIGGDNLQRRDTLTATQTQVSLQPVAYSEAV